MPHYDHNLNWCDAPKGLVIPDRQQIVTRGRNGSIVSVDWLPHYETTSRRTPFGVETTTRIPATLDGQPVVVVMTLWKPFAWDQRPVTRWEVATARPREES